MSETSRYYDESIPPELLAAAAPPRAARARRARVVERVDDEHDSEADE